MKLKMHIVPLLLFVFIFVQETCAQGTQGGGDRPSGSVGSTPGGEVLTPALTCVNCDNGAIGAPSTVAGETSAPVNAIIVNSGGAPGTIASIVMQDGTVYTVDPGDCPLSPSTIAVGAECTLTFEFSPELGGSFGDVIVITYDDGRTLEISVSGLSVGSSEPALSVNTLHFGSQPVGAASAAQTFIISNIGTADATVDSFEFTGTNAADFSATNILEGIFIGPGNGLLVNVFFTPSDTGPRTATFEVTVDGVVLEVDVDGTGGASSGRLSVTTVSARYVRLNSTGVGGATTGTGPWANASELYIYDADGAKYDRSTWTASANSQETVGETAPATNAKDGLTNTFWTTQWSPTSTNPPHYLCFDMQATRIVSAFGYLSRRDGTKNGNILTWTFQTSNTSCTADLVTRKGGTWDNNVPNPPERVESISTSPPLAFGSLTVGATSASQSIVIGNTGTGDLTISSIASTNAVFGVTHDCPISPSVLAPGATCSIPVTFTPDAAQAYDEAVQVTSDDPISPVTSFQLTGTGQSVSLVSVVVTPANNIVPQNTADIQYTARCNYSDGSFTANCNPQVSSWGSTNTIVATINGSGVADICTSCSGSTVISATVSGITGTTNLTVQAGGAAPLGSNDFETSNPAPFFINGSQRVCGEISHSGNCSIKVWHLHESVINGIANLALTDMWTRKWIYLASSWVTTNCPPDIGFTVGKCSPHWQRFRSEGIAGIGNQSVRPAYELLYEISVTGQAYQELQIFLDSDGVADQTFNTPNIGFSAAVNKGTWVCIEGHTKVSNPPVFDTYVNGVLAGSQNPANLSNIIGQPIRVWYWANNIGGRHLPNTWPISTNYAYIDDVAYGTSRIGCN